MATHSSILAWRIQQTEEPDRTKVHGIIRVGHDLATKPPPPRLAVGDGQRRLACYSPHGPKELDTNEQLN